MCGKVDENQDNALQQTSRIIPHELTLQVTAGAERLVAAAGDDKCAHVGLLLPQKLLQLRIGLEK